MFPQRSTYRPTDGLGDDAAVKPPPSDTELVVATLSWLVLGGLVGASLWVTGKEISRVVSGRG